MNFTEIPEELAKLNERFEDEFDLVIREKINLLKKEIDILNLTIDRLAYIQSTNKNCYAKRELVEIHLKNLEDWRNILISRIY